MSMEVRKDVEAYFLGRRLESESPDLGVHLVGDVIRIPRGVAQLVTEGAGVEMQSGQIPAQGTPEVA